MTHFSICSGQKCPIWTINYRNPLTLPDVGFPQMLPCIHLCEPPLLVSDDIWYFCAPACVLLVSTVFWASGHLVYSSWEARCAGLYPAMGEVTARTWVQPSEAFCQATPSTSPLLPCVFPVALEERDCTICPAPCAGVRWAWGVYTHVANTDQCRDRSKWISSPFFPPETQQFISFMAVNSKRWSNQLHMIPSGGASFLLFLPPPPLLFPGKTATPKVVLRPLVSEEPTLINVLIKLQAPHLPFYSSLRFCKSHFPDSFARLTMDPADRKTGGRLKVERKEAGRRDYFLLDGVATAEALNSSSGSQPSAAFAISQVFVRGIEAAATRWGPLRSITSSCSVPVSCQRICVRSQWASTRHLILIRSN